MAVQRNPGGGTTQTGYGKHGDRRLKRLRTRQAVEDAAREEFWEAVEMGEAYAEFEPADYRSHCD